MFNLKEYLNPSSFLHLKSIFNHLECACGENSKSSDPEAVPPSCDKEGKCVCPSGGGTIYQMKDGMCVEPNLDIEGKKIFGNASQFRM